MGMIGLSLKRVVWMVAVDEVNGPFSSLLACERVVELWNLSSSMLSQLSLRAHPATLLMSCIKTSDRYSEGFAVFQPFFQYLAPTCRELV